MPWYVVKGAIDMFAAHRSGGEAESDFRQVLRGGSVLRSVRPSAWSCPALAAPLTIVQRSQVLTAAGRSVIVRSG